MSGDHPRLKLVYFAFAGRSAPMRVACEVACVPLEFEGLTFDEWETANPDRERFPLGTLPVLEVVRGQGGAKHVMSESMAINQYIGDLTGFNPSDVFERAIAAEVELTIELIKTGIKWDPEDYNLYETFPIEDPEVKKLARSGAFTRRTRFYFTRVNELCKHLNGEKVYMCDMVLAGFWNEIKNGQFDHVETSWMKDLTFAQARVDKCFSDTKVGPVYSKLMAD
jgi:glutathione S-transferase